MNLMSAYDRDFHAWAMDQAEAIRSRSLNELDWDNLAEEVESLGKQQRAELRNRYEVLLMHLLKWMAQPDRRSRSWDLTIREQRTRIDQHLKDNPSLKSAHLELFDEAYETARIAAARETRLSLKRFPASAPFTAEQARDHDWLPE